MTGKSTHYFRASIQQFVAGMDDTAVVAVEADSKRSAINKATEPHLDKDDYYRFRDEVWTQAHDYDQSPATTPVHYLGTHADLFDGHDTRMLSAVEGERVTAPGVEVDAE